jgi:Na+/proline symporter
LIASELKLALGIAVVAYLLVMYAVAIVAARRVQTAEDFLVAGRRLPLSLAWMTLLATWFGAGTMLAVADEVRVEGVRAAALDPLGAGCCLLFVGLFVAGPMWREKLLTVPELFGRRFGATAELLSAAILVPSYFGWIAAQLTAIAGILELFFDIDPQLGLLLAALVGGGYTLLGGMWSVTLTDALQVSLALAGLVVLLFSTLSALGDGVLGAGWDRILMETPAAHLQLLPTEDWRELLQWCGLFVTGALGNVPVQDLMQRVFASKSEQVARRACLLAGGAYLVFGAIPVVLALAANVMFPDAAGRSMLPLMAQAVLSPTLAVIFIVCLMSVVLSTIDSAILSPASVLAQNVLVRYRGGDALRWNRICVAIVTLCSLAVAYQGESAFALLEQAYALTLVGLFVPLMMGLFRRTHCRPAATLSMLAGTLSWLVHLGLDWEYFGEPMWGAWQLPVALASTVVCLATYLAVEVACRIPR